MSWRDKTIERAYAYSTNHEPLSGWVVFCDWIPIGWHKNKPSKPDSPGLIIVDLTSRKFYVSVRTAGFTSTWILMDVKNYEVPDSEIEARLMLATCQSRLLDWAEHQLARQWPDDARQHFVSLARDIGQVIGVKSEVVK